MNKRLSKKSAKTFNYRGNRVHRVLILRRLLLCGLYENSVNTVVYIAF